MKTTILALCLLALAVAPGQAMWIQPALRPAPAAAKSAPSKADSNGVPYCSDPSIYNATLDAMLGASPDMPTQIVEIVAAVPIKELWGYIKLADFVSWNPLFNSVQTQDIFLCSPLSAVYNNGQFLVRYLPPKLSGPHHVIQMGCNKDNTTCAFGWFFELYEEPSGEMITYGRHTFTFIDNGDGTTTVKSWEKAAGLNVRYNTIGWTNALQESLHDAVLGILCMERVYQQNGMLSPALVTNNCMHFIV